MGSFKEKAGFTSVLFISIAGVTGLLMMDPIAQDPAYHQFADQRTFLGIPNFWNVVSNLPFLIVGAMGLFSIIRSGRISLIDDLKTAYVLLFAGVALVGLGSGYYHLWPGNETLVWDRLPMSLAAMSLFAIIIGEFASLKISRFLLWPLVVLGVFSVYYWHITESQGHGDLRLYALVQFLPMLLMPLLLLLFNPRFTNSRGYWAMMAAYLLAKTLEHFDAAVFSTTAVISGHSLKHIVAALGFFFLLYTYRIRVRL